MPEATWILNDSVPAPLSQEFSAAPSEAAWGWFGLPIAGEGSIFDSASVPWLEYDWLTLLGFMAAAQQGDSLPVAIPAIIYSRRRGES